MHRPAARHADRAFVRRAVHPQHPREMVLVANAGTFPSGTPAIRASSTKIVELKGHAATSIAMLSLTVNARSRADPALLGGGPSLWRRWSISDVADPVADDKSTAGGDEE